MSGYAIAQVWCADRFRGTAFAVGAERLLTCWHCVVDQVDPTRPLPEYVEVRFAPGVSTRATVLDTDADRDVALLGVAGLPSGWAALRLGRGSDAPRGCEVEVRGWPTDDPSTWTVPRPLRGRVEEERVAYGHDDSALQIHSPQLMGSTGLRPLGFSGSPVIARLPTGPVVVGVVRAIHEDPEAAGRAQGGLLYAARVDAVTASWAALRTPTDPVADLAGDSHAPLRDRVERFLSGHLRGPGGDPMPFAGRDGDLEALTAWLEDPGGPGYHLVTGRPGVGKSALVARWAVATAARPGVTVIVLPVSIRFQTNSSEALGALAYRLGRIHGEDWRGSRTATEARALVRTLLGRPGPPATSVLVVIDALDEAYGWTPADDLLPPVLGEGVRVLLSARHTHTEPSAARWADRLGITRNAAMRELQPLEEPAVSELLAAEWPDANHEDLAAAARRVWELTAGDPVTVALYLQDIRESAHPGPLAWAVTVTGRSPRLVGFIEGWWRQQEKLWPGRSAELQDANRMLRVLATAEGPISRAELLTVAGLLRRDIDDVRLRDVLELLARLVLPGASPDTYVIAHPAIAEVLRDRIEADGAAGTYRGLFEAWGVDVLSGLRTGRLPPGDAPGYLVRHLAQHLTAGVGLHAAAVLLATPYWRRVKDSVSDDPAGFRTDLETVLARARDLDTERVARGEAPRHLPERVIVAAELAGNWQALATAVTPGLAAQFVRHRLWRPGRALRYLEEHTYAGLTSRVDGVVAVASVVPPEEMPVFDRLVQSALRSTYREEQAEAVAAWAVRLLQLGRVDEALDAAFRLPATDPARRAFVAVWVFADLIPYLDEDRAARALAQAITVLRETTGDLSYAACRLTRKVPVHRAAELWPAADATPAEVLAHALLRQNGWRLQSIMHPERTEDVRHFADQSRGFVAVARWLTAEQRSAFIVRGVELATAPREPWESGRGMLSEPDMNRYHLKRALLPDITYDGLLSVLPAADAPAACEWVPRAVSGHEQLACLAQLLPLLDGADRRAVADRIFDAPIEELRRLDGDLNLLLPAVPAIVAGGQADRLIDRIRSDAHLSWLPVILAPHLTAEQARVLLEALPASADRRRPRNAVLARWASFGTRQAREAFDEAYAGGAAEVIDPDVMRSLRAYLSGDRDDGTSSYRRHPHVDDEAVSAVLEGVDPDPDGRAVLDVALALTRRLSAGDVPLLRVRAGTLADPWLALILLAAGTHVSPRATADTVTAEICARLDALRTIVAEAPRSVYPEDSHWLMHRFSGWAPYFARIVAPAARARIAEHLFAGGYLDGVVVGEDLDQWAADALGLTALLTREQLAWWERIARHGYWSPEDGDDAGDALSPRVAPPPGPRPKAPIRSDTLRAGFYAGIAVGYAAGGHLDDAYRVVQMIGGPNPADQRRDVLAEVLTTIGPADIPGWIAQVHATVGLGARRGPLWAHLYHRLPELTDGQMWTILDRWLTEVPRTARTDVFGDLLLYRAAIARVAGRDECARLMTLIEDRECLNTSTG